MGFLDSLPIGILPGSVPDDPNVPASRGDGQARAKAASPVTGKQLALQASTDLSSVLGVLQELLSLQQSDDGLNYRGGSVAGGGTAATTPLLVMKGNPKRRGLSVQNLASSGNLTVGLGMTSPQAGTGLVLEPGQSWDGRVSGSVWKGAVDVVGITGGVQYSWLEI